LHISGPAISLEWRYNRDQSAAADLDISEFRWRSPDLQNESFHAIEHHYYLDAREYSTDWTEVIFLGFDRDVTGGILYTQGLVLIRCREDAYGELGGDGTFRRLGYFSVRHDGIHGTPLPHSMKWPGRSFCIV
jgi:hypothetical protein